MTTDGQVGYYNNAGAYVSMNRTIGLSQFNNPAGLEKQDLIFESDKCIRGST